MTEQNKLKSDIKMLGSILGDTLKEQVGKDFFTTVEDIRSLSKSSRNDESQDSERRLKQLVRSLPDSELLNLARAFGQFLNLANIAENYHTLNRLHKHDDEFDVPSYLVHLEKRILECEKAGKSKEEIYNTIAGMNIELVLTAHPTEVRRRSLLLKYSKISKLLEETDRVNLTPTEMRRNADWISTLITSIWKTDEIRRTRPTPVEEAKWGMAVIEDTIWDSMPDYLEELDEMLKRHCNKTLPHNIAPIRFASWMGGDRDGNPNVTHKVTESVLLISRWKAASLYYRDIDNLIQQLSMTTCNSTMRNIVGEESLEPYRDYLRIMRRRMQATMEWTDAEFKKTPFKDEAALYLDPDELLKELEVCYDSLCETGCQKVADRTILRTIRRVSAFGLTLMRLDVRQESTRHEDVINTITEYLGLGSYSQWDEKTKQEFLIREIQSKRPLLPRDTPFEAPCQEVMDTIKTIANQTPDALGAYVISMATAASDVLEVRLLQKEGGIQHPMRIVPLFETLDDLNNAEGIMDELFSIPFYRKEIGNCQEVMIGYSDSGKDAGKVAASWAQYRAQEALVSVACKHGVELNLFHGRGGSIGRGGGPVQHALLSQPPGSVQGRMRVTEQGEVITQKFSTADAARHNMLLYVAAVLEATLLPPRKPKKEWCDIMDKMSAISCEEYRDVVRGHKDFVPYFRAVTPEQELGRLHIGSRPAKRKASGGIESLRAIPWIFAWTQNRLMLPAWLGIGSSLEAIVAEEGKEVLQKMIQEWPFFFFLMDALDMVFAKADQRIAAYYDECLADDSVKHLGEDLRERLEKASALCSDLVKDLQIHEDRIELRASIHVRNPYADLLNIVQGEVLRRLRREKRQETPELEDTVMLTIAGISAAMKNTG